MSTHIGHQASTVVTAEKKATFLDALAHTGNVRKAAKLARVSPHGIYRQRNTDEAFKRAWEQAVQDAADTVLEPEAIRRAVDGVLKPVYQAGEKVGSVREYSDTLLIFLLKGAKKEKYAERRETFHRGLITLLHKMEQLAQMTPEQREAFLLEVEAYVAHSGLIG